MSPLQTLQSTTAPQPLWPEHCFQPLGLELIGETLSRASLTARLLAPSLPHLHSPQVRASAPSTERLRPPTPQPLSLFCHPASPPSALAPPPPNPSFLPPPPPARLRRSPPYLVLGGPGAGGWGSEPRGRPVSGGWQSRCQWCRLPRASLSRPAASEPAPPRCRSEGDAPRVRAAAPAAASLQHRLTAASAPVPAPQTRALGRAALTDERHSQCKGTEAASPAAPQAHLPPPRRTQASRPQGFPALRRLSRSLAVVPGPPARKIPNLAPRPFPGTQAP